MHEIGYAKHHQTATHNLEETFIWEAGLSATSWVLAVESAQGGSSWEAELRRWAHKGKTG